MTATDFDYITAVFLHYLQPIADLCERMLDQCSGEPNEVQTSARENGYALSIISLTAFFFEGACGRARYFNGLAAVGIPALANPLDKL